MASLHTVMNSSHKWFWLYPEVDRHYHRVISPRSAQSFEWFPWVPWCRSQGEFNAGHYIKLTAWDGVNTWYLYQRWGEVKLFSEGYERGFQPPGFPLREDILLNIWFWSTTYPTGSRLAGRFQVQPGIVATGPY